MVVEVEVKLGSGVWDPPVCDRTRRQAAAMERGLAAVKVFLPQSCLFAQFHSLSVLTKQHRNIHTLHAIVRAHACTHAREQARTSAHEHAQ